MFCFQHSQLQRFTNKKSCRKFPKKKLRRLIFLSYPMIVPWLTIYYQCVQAFVIFTFSPACQIASSSTSGGSSQLTSPQHSALTRVNQGQAIAAAAANAAIAASRRGSYPLNAVAALTAAQQRNLAAMAQAGGQGMPITTSTGNTMLSGSTAGPMVSTGSANPAHSQQHAAANSPLTALAGQQLHGLTQ